jgi:arylformamidase
MFLKHSLIAAIGVFVPMLAFADPSPMQACMSDIKTLCGSNRANVRECIKEHHAQLSMACKAAIADRMLEHGGSQVAGAPRN